LFQAREWKTCEPGKKIQPSFTQECDRKNKAYQ
jgi:hypothetical protein